MYLRVSILSECISEYLSSLDVSQSIYPLWMYLRVPILSVYISEYLSSLRISQSTYPLWVYLRSMIKIPFDVFLTPLPQALNGGAQSQEQCDDQITSCLKTFSTVEDSGSDENICRAYETFASCVTGITDCGLSQQRMDMILEESASGISSYCGGTASETYTGTATGTGAGSETQGGSRTGLAMVVLFSKHECYQVPSECSSSITVTSDCSAVRASGQCIFNECPKIRGTGDDKRAADLLVQSAKESFGCNFKASEFLGNGGFGVLRRPVWESLGFLLTAALLTKFLLPMTPNTGCPYLRLSSEIVQPRMIDDQPNQTLLLCGFCCSRSGCGKMSSSATAGQRTVSGIKPGDITRDRQQTTDSRQQTSPARGAAGQTKFTFLILL
ncbi:hypothetical protein RRG08_013406 [Elysia crispata]|uniref:Uncharacterized protein n=1 Tax=Elysia crispata TaxID=231223 RepID=A0AAE1EBI3_9GAST|nr:hypothetical protein RRG08_013406 [Elysia crispata]